MKSLVKLPIALLAMLLLVGLGACDTSSDDDSNLCEEVECSDGQTCDPEDGVCKNDVVDLCEDVECSDGQTCDPEDGVCKDDVVDLCEDVECPDGQTCDPEDGVCKDDVVDLCEAVECPEGQTCDPEDGVCKDDVVDPCEDVTCGDDEHCVEGTCYPNEETTCDDIDDDMDGETDEGLEQACATDCGEGTEICEAGAWIDCDAPEPQDEDCDGVDNDCDGETDEGLFARDCSNDCGPGAEFCIEGAWQDCTAREPLEADGCGDAIDNDCDGEIDENCPACTLGDRVPCSTNEIVGICSPGTRLCEATGLWSDLCEDDGGFFVIEPGQVSEDDELCNGLDDDCDGATDEGQSCPED